MKNCNPVFTPGPTKDLNEPSRKVKVPYMEAIGNVVGILALVTRPDIFLLPINQDLHKI